MPGAGAPGAMHIMATRSAWTAWTIAARLEDLDGLTYSAASRCIVARPVLEKVLLNGRKAVFAARGVADGPCDSSGSRPRRVQLHFPVASHKSGCNSVMCFGGNTCA